MDTDDENNHSPPPTVFEVYGNTSPLDTHTNSVSSNLKLDF